MHPVFCFLFFYISVFGVFLGSGGGRLPSRISPGEGSPFAGGAWCLPRASSLMGPPGLPASARPPEAPSPRWPNWGLPRRLPPAGFGSQAICFGKLLFCAQGEAQSSIDSASQALLLEIEVYKCLFEKRGCRVSQRARLLSNWRPWQLLIVTAWALRVWSRHHSCVSV